MQKSYGARGGGRGVTLRRRLRGLRRPWRTRKGSCETERAGCQLKGRRRHRRRRWQTPQRRARSYLPSAGDVESFMRRNNCWEDTGPSTARVQR